MRRTMSKLAFRYQILRHLITSHFSNDEYNSYDPISVRNQEFELFRYIVTMRPLRSYRPTPLLKTGGWTSKAASGDFVSGQGLLT